MANRRMISKSISVSEQVNDLSAFAALLFTWMIAHADDFGRMPGSPAKIRALVIPMRKESEEDVASALSEMVHNRLIIWYEIDHVPYIQFKTWDKHQTGLHKRTSSSFPEPPEHSDEFPELPGNSRSTELNLTKQNLKSISSKDTQEIIETQGQKNNKRMLLSNNVNPYEEIEIRMQTRMGKPYYPRQTDAVAIKQFLDNGVPLDFILNGIDSAFERGNEIHSFSYCAKIIKDLWGIELAKHKPSEPMAFSAQWEIAASREPPSGRRVSTGLAPEVLKALQEDEERERGLNSS